MTWRAQQRSWGYPARIDGPVVKLWDVVDEDGASIALGTVNDGSESTARLLAASRGLLASLKEFVELYEGTRDVLGVSVRDKLRRAEAAIAKAEGR